MRHHIGERAQHGRQGGDHPRPSTTKAQAKKIRDCVQVQFAQIGGHKQCHQTEATGPAHHVGQPSWLGRRAGKTLQVQPAGQTDERGCAHPVCGRGHAVVNGWNPAPRDVVFAGLGGASINANRCIQGDGGKQKNGTDPLLGQPKAFGQGKRCQKAQQANHVASEPAVQSPLVGVVGQRVGPLVRVTATLVGNPGKHNDDANEDEHRALRCKPESERPAGHHGAQVMRKKNHHK